MLKLKIVRDDPAWVVIDKPTRFHTHPPEDQSVRILPRWNALGILSKQLGYSVYPAHRLDRATSGLLLFSKSRKAAEALQPQFASRDAGKSYFALVRGKFLNETEIKEPLRVKGETLKDAHTLVFPIAHFALPLLHPKGGDRVFTFVKAVPLTGRFHQIRRHLAGSGFPILGDTRHGDKKLNREFAHLTGCETLMLRSMELNFDCPRTGARIRVINRWNREWHRIFGQAGVCPLTASPYQAPPSLS